MNTHQGRVAVVTGAARGIGRAVAVELARRGADIVAVDADPAGGTVDAVKQVGRRALSLQADISNPGQVNALSTRGLANDLAPHGITVNAVCPTASRTPVMSHVGEERLQTIANSQAIKRIGTAEDVVGTVSFLASEDSGFMTGQTLVPDGGLMRV